MLFITSPSAVVLFQFIMQAGRQAGSKADEQQNQYSTLLLLMLFCVHR